MLQDLKGARSVLTRDAIRQDAEVIQEAKATVEGLKEHAQNRDAIREAGISRESARMAKEHAQNGRTCIKSEKNSGAWYFHEINEPIIFGEDSHRLI